MPSSMKFTTPNRADLEKFIADPRTLRAFEGLFDLVNAGKILLAGDIIWSAASARDGALTANGAAVSRTLYADLFAAIGTVYGVGDGSTTFNLPDLGGRVVAGKEATESRITTAISGFSGATLGAVAPAGAQAHALTIAELAAHTHVLATDIVKNIGAANITTGINLAHQNAGAHTTESTGSGTAHRNVQPTIILNAF